MTRKIWQRLIISTVLVYLLAWAILYYSMMGFDVGHLPEYFYLSWTGGLENIAYMQGGAIIIALGYIGIRGLLYLGRRFVSG